VRKSSAFPSAYQKFREAAPPSFANLQQTKGKVERFSKTFRAS
jgi:hypothetical protein